MTYTRLFARWLEKRYLAKLLRYLGAGRARRRRPHGSAAARPLAPPESLIGT